MNKKGNEQDYSVSKLPISKAAKQKSVYHIKESFVAGIWGFIILFSLLLGGKFMAVLSESIITFKITINDFIIAFWGFIIFSFIMFASRNKTSLKS